MDRLGGGGVGSVLRACLIHNCLLLFVEKTITEHIKNYISQTRGGVAGSILKGVYPVLNCLLLFDEMTIKDSLRELMGRW
jgi:hypothetical protein